MPSDWPAMRPRGLARSGWRVTATRTPCSSALLSVSPTPATSGRVKTVPAMASRLIGSTSRPSAESAEMRPCMAAVEASIQPPVTSPAAEMRSFEVRQLPLILISPRGPTSTPTELRPSSSVCARMPMQMIACVPVNCRPSSAVDAHAVAVALDVRGAGVQLDRHAALEEGLVHDVGDVAILRSAGSAGARRAASRASRSSGRTRRTRSRWRRRRRRAAARAARAGRARRAC